MHSDTIRIPRPVLLPPVAPDRRDKLILTPRGRTIRDVFAGTVIGGFTLGFNTLTHAAAEFALFVGQFVPGSVL